MVLIEELAAGRWAAAGLDGAVGALSALCCEDLLSQRGFACDL